MGRDPLKGEGSPPALRVGGKGWLCDGWGLAKQHRTLPATWTQHPHFTEMDPTPSLPSSHYAWWGRQGASSVFRDSFGEEKNSLVELLGSELSLRGSKTQKHGEGTPGRGHSPDTGREVGRKVQWALKPAQLDEEAWGGDRDEFLEHLSLAYDGRKQRAHVINSLSGLSFQLRKMRGLDRIWALARWEHMGLTF